MKKNLLICLLFLTTTAHGLQLKNAQGDNKIVADISQTSINRIAVQEDRIAQIFGLNEDLAIETDEHTGQIFLRVKQNKPIDLNLVTEKQLTLDLRLVPKNIPGETIIIKTHEKLAKSNAKASAYVEELRALLLAMANNKEFSGFVRRKIDKASLRCDKINFQETDEYLGNKLVGKVYTLTNNTKDRIELNPNFTEKTAKKEVAAAAIKKAILEPHEQIQVYLIRHLL